MVFKSILLIKITLIKPDIFFYQQIVNNLTYTIQEIYFNITYSIFFYSRFLAKPTRKYIKLLKVLRYLKKIFNFDIIYVRHEDNSFSVYTNFNYNKRILFNGKNLQAPKGKGKTTSK